MDPYYSKVKEYLLDLDIAIIKEFPEDNLLIADKEEAGIKNLVLICTEPILIMEQHLFAMDADNVDTFKELLKKNREMVHGAFALDDSGKQVIFRDTLQLENLDLNELQGTLQALELLMIEYTNQLLAFSKK
jgi:hypothetical protein